MEVLGIPGSLEQLLQPVRERAVRGGLFPHSFEQLWRLGGGEMVQMARNSQNSVTEYQGIVEVFMKLYAPKE